MARALLLVLLIPISLVQGDSEPVGQVYNETEILSKIECKWVSRESGCSGEWDVVTYNSDKKYAYWPAKSVKRYGEKGDPDNDYIDQLCCKNVMPGTADTGCRYTKENEICLSSEMTLFIIDETKKAYCCNPEKFGLQLRPEISARFPEESCKWTDCNEGEPANCELGYTELGSVNSAYQTPGVSSFGKKCYSREFLNTKIDSRTLCCKNEVIHADPNKYCGHAAEQELCAYGKVTVYISEYFGFRGYCCDPKVFTGRSKRFISNSAYATTTSFLLILTSAISMMH